jgi:alcohol dehydrogenase, propanol-preferring
MTIPKTQRAAVRVGSGESARVEIQEIPVPTLQPGQMLVKLHCSGLCASDKSLIHDEWSTGAAKLMMQPSACGVAGHEGAGVVVALHGGGGDGQAGWAVGDRAGVKWIAATCGAADCEMCANGRDECHCPRQLNSGFTVPGTFQEYVATDAR